MGSTVRKPCVLCNAECDGRARVKDPQGRYYCRACYDRKAAELQSRPDAAGDVTETDPLSDPSVDFRDLAVAAAAAPVDAMAMATCPACHGALAPGSVFCVGCGHDLRTGNKAAVRVVKAANANGASPFGRGGSRGTLAAGSGLKGLGWTVGLGSTAVVTIAVLTMIADTISRAGQRPGPAASVGVDPMTPIATPFFLIAVVGAVLIGFLWSYVGPWWFRIRVGWAGGSAASDAARSSYFAAVLPYSAIAGASAAVGLTSGFGSGLFNTLQVVSVGVLFLSCAMLFWIAKQAFGTKTVGGALLLVVLPWAWYVVQIVTAVAVIAFLSELQRTRDGLRTAPPQPQRTEAPAPVRESALSQVHEANATYPIRIQYPNDWTLTELPKTQPKASGIRLVATSHSTIAINVATDRVNLDEWERLLLRGYRAQGAFVTNGGAVDSIGRWKGSGRSMFLDRKGSRMVLRFLMVEAGDGQWLMIEMLTHSPDRFGDDAMVARILDSISVGTK